MEVAVVALVVSRQKCNQYSKSATLSAGWQPLFHSCSRYLSSAALCGAMAVIISGSSGGSGGGGGVYPAVNNGVEATQFSRKQIRKLSPSNELCTENRTRVTPNWPDDEDEDEDHHRRRTTRTTR